MDSRTIRYRPVTAERRQHLTSGAGGFKWAILFAIVALVAVMLLQAQQERHGQMPRIRAGYDDDERCECGHCHRCRERDNDHECGL
ncbi:hypothetical protein [Azonexus sp. IMCC34839]|uniref:hypothetical protein n=1 Tax=Azonexus sp. IMCC34839 TaxID=3133695 RepID=UPI00399C015A